MYNFAVITSPDLVSISTMIRSGFAENLYSAWWGLIETVEEFTNHKANVIGILGTDYWESRDSEAKILRRRFSQPGTIFIRFNEPYSMKNILALLNRLRSELMIGNILMVR